MCCSGAGRRPASPGWVSYTYAHTRYHDRITGEDFDGDFDQRHTLNLFLQERLSYRMAISAKLRVGSNFPLVGYFQGSPDALSARAPSATRSGCRPTRGSICAPIARSRSTGGV